MGNTGPFNHIIFDRYDREPTIMVAMTIEDAEALGADLPSSDKFGAELFELAEKARGLVAERERVDEDATGLEIVVLYQR